MTPPPQPTSTTDGPAWNLSTTPSSAGSTAETRARRDQGPVMRAAGVVHIDGTEHAIRTGSTVFIHAMASHSVRNTGSEPSRLF